MEQQTNNDYISRFNRIVDDSTQQAAALVNKYSKPKYVAALIEIVISAVAIVGIQIIAMGFDFSKMANPTFWIRTVALTVCIFLLYRAVVNARFEKTASRQSVIDVKKKYKDKCDKKELDLKDYLEEFNLKTKTTTYVTGINRRINKLERKRIKTFNLKKKTRLKAKIDILKEEITPKRVEEVIDFVKVKYYIVCYDDFENIERIGGNDKIETRGDKAYYKQFNFRSFNKIWAYFLATIILSISIWSFGEATTIQIIANVLSSLVMIITRVLSALVESDRIYDSTITASYVCKTEILEQYFIWKEQRAKEKTLKLEEKKIEEQKKVDEVKPILLGYGTQPTLNREVA